MNNTKNQTNSFHFQFTISESEVGIRLDKFISTLPDLKKVVSTRNYASQLIEEQHILVNSKAAKASYILKLNDQIEVQIPEKKSSELMPYDFKLDIVFEDKNYIVINKPAGLVIHPAAGHEQDTLVNALLFHSKDLSMKNEERPGIVHRIDKETSGLLVVAKNDQAHEHLAKQFKNKTTHRIYYAVIKGIPLQKKGTLKSYLQRHPTDRKRYASIRENNKIKNQFEDGYDKGKWAVTHYEVLQTIQLDKNTVYSLVKLKLETGRTHQIRVHMSELGHPLVGDTLYGFSKLEMQKLKISRFYLHAAELGFEDIESKQKHLFKINWPAVDLKILAQWGFNTDV